MLTPEESLRRRLESLNRDPLPASTIVKPRPAPPSRPRSVAASLAGLLRRGEVVPTDVGEHLRVLLPLDDLWPGGEELVRKRHGYLIGSAAAGPRPSPDPSPSRGGERKEEGFRCFVDAFPDRVLLLDLETCGLAGSAMFLAGVLRSIDSRMTVELLLARNYAEESAVLASLWQRLDGAELVVTFNGKSFDWPMVVDRSRRHLLAGGRGKPTPAHLDLLHAARRRWRKELPDCRLQTLEERICGRRREGDIPGSQIPAAYQEYVRSGFEREMEQILRHNALDLVTLLDLAMRLCG